MQQSYYFAEAKQEFQDRNQWYNVNLHLLEFRIIYEMIQILKIKRHK